MLESGTFSLTSWHSSLLNVGLDRLVCSHLCIPGINGRGVFWGEIWGQQHGVSVQRGNVNHASGWRS